jgi:type VI secretion system protein ImpE
MTTPVTRGGDKMAADPDVQETAAEARLRAGDSEGARQALLERLRAHPQDQRARMFLFQILCVEGAWDKARAQLGTLAQLSPEAQMLAVAYRQAIDAETARAAACAGDAPAPVLHGEADWMADLARAFALCGEAAAGLRGQAFDAAPDTPGEVDGRPFDFLYDGDARFGPALEAIVAGRWGLVPFAALEEIRTEGPVDLRDLVWLPVELRFRAGGTAAALLPARYPGTEEEADAEFRLARRTVWRQENGVVRGLGQRVWTTSAGDDIGILSFRSIRFATPA